MSIGHYEAYGTALATAYANNPYGYRGYYTDTETGFAYLRARYYDPATQRFTQEDTYWGDNMQRNLYAYCSGNPVMYTDPSGHFMEYPNRTINHIATPVSVIDLETGITYTDSGRLIWGESVPHGYELSEATIRAARNRMKFANHYQMSNNTKVLEAINQCKTFLSVKVPGLSGSDSENNNLVLVDFEVYEINLSGNASIGATQVLRDLRDFDRDLTAILRFVKVKIISGMLTGGFVSTAIGTVDSILQYIHDGSKDDDIFVGEGVYFRVVGIYKNERGIYFSLSSLISLTQKSSGVTYDMKLANFDPTYHNIIDFNNIAGYK
jgi:RHS repeat-associated protein